ncbi:MAG: site-2 protease family protein [Clostridia bacterium]|nr:site-2 protease family protein [Clostridia bacterium]
MRKIFKSPLFIIVFIMLALGPIQSLFTEGIQGVAQWFLETIMILPAIVIALSFHEYAHAKMADMAGDPTPRNMGRVTIDPRAHIDPFGLIALIFIRFGWGKPVMINPLNFKSQRRDSILVGLSGVSTNFVLALIFGGIILLINHASPAFFNAGFGHNVGFILIEVVIINITLMLFNLLPIPPLDGFGVLADIFNLHHTNFYRFVYQNSMLILMVAVILGLPGKLLSGPLVYIVNFIMSGIYGLPGWWGLLS